MRPGLTEFALNAPSYLVSDTPHTGPDLPPGTGKLGMWLFLAALFMLFAATIVAYVMIRITGTHSPEAGVIQLPPILWGSSLAMLGSSVTMHFALIAIRRDDLSRFRLDMIGTTVLAFLFLAMQTPGLFQLLAQHERQMEANIHLYGLIFFIILLHALHIVGGLIPLLVALSKTLKNRYSAQDHNGILYLTMYWHFLDAVWIALFAVFLVMG